MCGFVGGSTHAWAKAGSKGRLKQVLIVTLSREKTQVYLAASGLVSRECIVDVGWIGVWVCCVVRLSEGLLWTKSKLFSRLLLHVRVYENVCLLVIFTCLFFTNGRENKSRQLNNCHLVLVKTLNGFMKEFLLNDRWKGLG